MPQVMANSKREPAAKDDEGARGQVDVTAEQMLAADIPLENFRRKKFPQEQR